MTPLEVALAATLPLLLVASALLAAAQTALARVSRARALALADDLDTRATRALVELTTRPERFGAGLRVAWLACLVAEVTVVAVLADRLGGTVTAVVASVVNLVVVVILADTTPRTWAGRRPERAALLLARPVRSLAGSAPVRLPAGVVGRMAHVLAPGGRLAAGPSTAEPEPIGASGLVTDESVIEQDERQLIESIIDFGDTVAREIMVPRPDMVTVDATFRVADVMEIMLLNGYSRVPACGGGIDDVVGLVYAKDLMRAERDGKEHHSVSEFLRPAVFVPETQRLPELLRDMQQRQFHMAIVLDEYGGTSGLVTLEDIIEELVGEILDEYDVEDPMIEPLPGGDALVRGRTPLDEVNDLLNADLPEGDWDTVGGLVYSRLGHVPVEGESVVISGWTLTAQRIQGRRIGRVRVSPPAPPPPAGDDTTATANGADPTTPNGTTPLERP